MIFFFLLGALDDQHLRLIQEKLIAKLSHSFITKKNLNNIMFSFRSTVAFKEQNKT